MNSPHAFIDSDAPIVPMAKVKHVPLQAHSLLRHAAQVHRDTTVTSVSSANADSSITYEQLEQSVARKALYLQTLGIGVGDTVINMGMSSIEQLAWLYAALRMGAITQLMNPLLAPEQSLQLMAQAQAPLVLFDTATASLAASAAGLNRSLIHFNMDDPEQLDRLPMHKTLLDASFPEDTPAIVCYSSGTTGLPKAAQYSHRSTVLHAWGCALPDAMGLTAQDRIMPLMQMFHATAWGAPFVAPLVGASLIMVPPTRDPRQWYEWIEEYEVSVLGAVTAHWAALVQYMRANHLYFTRLRRTVVGGTRLPEALAEIMANEFGVEVRHAWGMTETSPLATIEKYSPGTQHLRHGKPVFGIEIRIGEAAATPTIPYLDELHVRGHWVAHRQDETWLRTGDLALIHDDGCLEVIDRIQDSLGGDARQISSSLVEFHARFVPGVADASVVKMDSGDVVLAWVPQAHADQSVVNPLICTLLKERFDGWSPDHVVAVNAFPYTPSAKVQKNQLKRVLSELLHHDNLHGIIE